MCVLIFSTNLSETLLILRINERDMVINVRRSLCKVSFNSSQNLKKLAFSRQILKNTQSSNLMEIRPVRAELFRAGGRTERQSDRQTDSQTDRQSDRQSVRQRESQSDRQTVRQIESQSDRQADRQTDRQTECQTDSQTDRQAGSQTYR